MPDERGSKNQMALPWHIPVLAAKIIGGFCLAVGIFFHLCVAFFYFLGVLMSVLGIIEPDPSLGFFNVRLPDGSVQTAMEALGPSFATIGFAGLFLLGRHVQLWPFTKGIIF